VALDLMLSVNIRLPIAWLVCICLGSLLIVVFVLSENLKERYKRYGLSPRIYGPWLLQINRKKAVNMSYRVSRITSYEG
jgi:hypothetical protein